MAIEATMRGMGGSGPAESKAAYSATVAFLRGRGAESLRGMLGSRGEHGRSGNCGST